jgi:hypothetical protein
LCEYPSLETFPNFLMSSGSSRLPIEDDIPEDERFMSSSVSSNSIDESNEDEVAGKIKKNRNRPWKKLNQYENVQTDDVNVIGVSVISPEKKRSTEVLPYPEVNSDYDDTLTSNKWKQRLPAEEEKKAYEKAMELERKQVESKSSNRPDASNNDDASAASEHQRVRMEALKLLNLADSGSNPRPNKITSTSSALRGLDFDHKTKERSWNHSTSTAHAYERVNPKSKSQTKTPSNSDREQDDDDLSYDGSVNSKKSWSNRYSVDRHLDIMNNGRLYPNTNREIYTSANNMYKTSPHLDDIDPTSLNSRHHSGSPKNRMFTTWIYNIKESVSDYIRNARADGYTSGSHRKANHSGGNNGIFTGVAVTNFLHRLTPSSRAKAQRRNGTFLYDNVNFGVDNPELGVLYRGYRPADAYLAARRRRKRQCLFWGTLITVALVAISSIIGIASTSGSKFSNAAIEIGEEIRFFVTNDIPYNTADADKLRRELDVLSTDYGDFLIHLGDVQNARTSLCAYSQYDDVATLLWDHSDVPVFMIPGNNDWNECPMPWSAFEYWMEKLNRFEEWYATDKYDLPLVGRQNSRDENFAFLSKGVLFIGLNLVDGTVQDESEWDLRHLQNVQWVEQQLSENDEGEYRAIVMMGHAGFSSKVGDFFWPVIDRLKEVNKPVLYLHANDGSGMIEYSPVPDFPKFVAVRMEKGGIVGPTIVSVKGGDAPFSFTVMDA